MNILEQTIRQSLESIAPSGKPMVSIYTASANPVNGIDITGVDVQYRGIGQSLEGMQQVEQHLMAKAVDAAADAVEDSSVRGNTHSDYNLYVVTPDVTEGWFEVLGETSNLTGALLTGELSEYDVNVVSRISETLGLENIFHSAGQASVGIERTLHRKGVL